MDTQTKNQIVQTVGTQTQQAYQSRFSLISSAAALAILPNWKNVLHDEFTAYEAEMAEQCKLVKDNITSQVPPEAQIEARSIITDTMDKAIAASKKHYDGLVSMIEKLNTTDSE